jgi:hypothetical protein
MSDVRVAVPFDCLAITAITPAASATERSICRKTKDRQSQTPRCPASRRTLRFRARVLLKDAKSRMPGTQPYRAGDPALPLLCSWVAARREAVHWFSYHPHQRVRVHVQEIRQDHTHPYSLVSQKMNGTGALRQFVPKAIRPSPRVAFWRKRRPSTASVPTCPIEVP